MGERISGVMPLSASAAKTRFTRGTGAHRSVSWFAIKWLSTNLAHLLASKFAVEDIDSRDWMHADEPETLCARMGKMLGARTPGPTLTETLGRELWIDYIADTGDDDVVSERVAELVARTYEVTDDEGRLLRAPRGDLLCFGGDTAYPVATAREIRDRVLTPWNRVLRACDDGKKRPILGIPGNHDWNDGLDGFGRLFRRREKVEVKEREDKPTHGVLALHGYEPVQSASYFNVPLAPGLDLWGADRQLGHVDHRQRQFFARTGANDPTRARILMQADPHRAFCRENPPGMQVTERLGIQLKEQPHLVLAGDIHQYQRWIDGPTVHVTAGGGGASLHGAALAFGREPPLPDPEFPTAAECKPLLGEIVSRVATGKAGWFIHTVIALVALAVCGLLAWPLDRWGLVAAGGVLFLASVIGARTQLGDGASFPGVLLGLSVAAPPLLLGLYYPEPLLVLGDVIPVLLAASGSALLGGTVAGLAILMITRSGVDHYIGWAALAHPGFKHFVRLRVHRDGSRVDAWCFGLRDPCAADEPVLLVDHFTWRTGRREDAKDAVA